MSQEEKEYLIWELPISPDGVTFTTALAISEDISEHRREMRKCSDLVGSLRGIPTETEELEDYDKLSVGVIAQDINGNKIKVTHVNFSKPYVHETVKII